MGKGIHLKKTVTKDRKIYGNCSVLSPDGKLMFRCGMKKVNWYLSKGLAEKVGDDPITIKLNFKPKGNGYHEEKWGLAEMNNVCVNCNTDEFLTRHHVVPYGYRKYFPMLLKTHNFHDVLAMCPDCHDDYERKADVLKMELSVIYDSPLSGVNDIDRGASKMKRLVNCIVNHSNDIPSDKLKVLKQDILDYYGWKRLTKKRIDWITSIKTNRNLKTHGEMVCERIDDYQDFIELWRTHFVDNNSCEYLPENWSINYVHIGQDETERLVCENKRSIEPYKFEG